MFFKRYYLESLSQASYMVADEKTHVAAVIDPRRDVDLYLDEARKRRFTIAHVILTHIHADFIAGHIELRDKAGARIYLGAQTQATFDFKALHEGDELVLGAVRLKILETPGHTPEGISVLVFDDAEDSKNPHAVLTGDTLFIGDVGRPDLLASIGVTADDLGGMLYDSLHNKLLKLPGGTRVYPAHGAGSMCGKSLSDKAVSTLAEEGQSNQALRKRDKAAFVQWVQADLPPAPAYFSYDAGLNREERPGLETAIRKSMKRLEIEDILLQQQAGVWVLDLRPVAEFASSHLRGAVNIGMDGRFETWVGTLFKANDPLILIAEPTRIKEALIRLARIGFHSVVGYLQGGMASLKDRPERLSHTKQLTVGELVYPEKNRTVIDIRTASEWKEAHIDGSINIPLNELPARLKEVPDSGEVIMHCQGGYRSMIAASLLEKAGWKNVRDLIGGYAAWAEEKGVS